MALDQYKTQVLLLHSEQSALDTLSVGWSEKYSVHVATSGTEALNIFNDTPVHVIVSAQDLPGMSGLDALREAKKRSPETIGILLAGNDASDGLEALVGDKEVFQIVRGEVTADGLRTLIESATTRSRILALSDSANDTSASPDHPMSEHIVMETSENGAVIISDGTGQMPVLKPDKISIDADSASSEVDVLVLTKDEEFLATIKDSSRGLHNVHHCVTPSQANEAVSNHQIGVLVTDAAMVGSNIEILTQRLRQSAPRLVAVVAGRRDDGELLMDLINRGQVYRFLLKPVSPGRARLAIEASIKHHLEAADSAFKPAATENPVPAQQAARPAKSAKAAKTARPAEKPKAAPPRADQGKRAPRPMMASRDDSVVTDRLDDAFDDNPSFTETITGLAISIGKKFSEKSSNDAAAERTEPTMARAETPPPKKAKAKKPAAVKPAPAKPVEPAPAQPVKAAPAQPVKPAPAVTSRSKAPTARPAPQPGEAVPQPMALHDLGGDSNKPMFIGIAAAVFVAIAAGAYFLGGSGEEETDPAPVMEEGVAAPSIAESEIMLEAPAPATAAPVSSEVLDAARDAVTDGRIVTPPADNAVEYYVAALAADKGNPQIAAELDGIIERVVGLAESAILEARAEDASIALQMIEFGSPDNPRLAFLNAQLDQLQLRDAIGGARIAIRENRFEDAGRMIERAAAYAGGTTPEIDLLSGELASARSAQRVDEVLVMAAARLDQDQLITPSNNNARYYYELALSTDPDNTAARQGLLIVADKLVLQARAAIDVGQFVNAEDLLRNARLLDPSSTELAAATATLEQTRAAKAQADNEAREQAERQAQEEADRQAREEADRQARQEAEREAERLAEEKAEEERRREAAAAAALAAAATGGGSDAAGAAATAAGSQAADAPAAIPESQANSTKNDGESAQFSPPDAATTLAALNPTAPSADDEIAQQQPAVEVVPISQLTRTNYVPPKYPRSAQRRNITGSVDIAFTVGTNGKVSDIEVLDSTKGSTFDQAAIDAVAQWRFEPTIVRGQPVERRTAVRLAFNLQ